MDAVVLSDPVAVVSPLRPLFSRFFTPHEAILGTFGVVRNEVELKFFTFVTSKAQSSTVCRCRGKDYQYHGWGKSKNGIPWKSDDRTGLISPAGRR